MLDTLKNRVAGMLRWPSDPVPPTQNEIHTAWAPHAGSARIFTAAAAAGRARVPRCYFALATRVRRQRVCKPPGGTGVVVFHAMHKQEMPHRATGSGATEPHGAAPVEWLAVKSE